MNEKKEKSWIDSPKVANVVSVISCIGTILGVIVSIISLHKANEALQQINNIDAERVGYIQSGENIINEGISVEDANFIAEDNDKEMMNKAYRFEGILERVAKDPNLNFSLIWSGSEEEYKNLDLESMPPCVTYYIAP